MEEGPSHGESRALRVQSGDTSSAKPVAGTGEGLWGEPRGKEGSEASWGRAGGSEPGAW